ncbi:MAG TPA: alpha/beta hydrolase family protein [archaeon]|nr:alpha/beta hydrolase family protein [archaeon]
MLVLLLLLSTSLSVFAQEEDLSVLARWVEWSDGEHMLIHYLNRQAFGYLDLRDQELSKLNTKVDWIKRQAKVKEILMQIVGPFPEKTPLNPRITQVVKKDGYRIEKIIYQSMPNFYVTGCLFIPDQIKGKRPAILNVIGHTGIAFRGEGYQIFIQNLVRKGFIVFAIDPIGQGERLQYYDPGKKASVIGGPTSEHSYVGNQCFICGTSLGRYFAWDGIRGIDYLLTRKEVDPEKIGITGISGGGTQTSYIAALDDRIKASAPTCYITGFRRLLESIGPQDAEQNFYHGVASGITHADLLELRAPKPTLIVATTRDFFSIQGARETFAEVKRSYQAFGKEENASLVEDDHGHGYTRKNREAIYSFFQKTLEFPGNPADQEVEILKPEELNVTPTGQISTYLPGESVFSLNQKNAQKLIEKIAASRKDIESHLDQVRTKARELSGYATPAEGEWTVFRGRYQREGYSIELYALQGEGAYVVPLLVFVPGGSGKFPAVIYLNPEGKSADASAGSRIEKLVKKGFLVAAADLIGTGETADKSESADYAAVLIGRSIPGIQAGDVSRVVNFLKNRADVQGDRIGAVAFNELCPALLHAAAFDKSISKVTLVGSPVSYQSIVMNRFYEFGFPCAVAGALTAYDLPDLAGCIAPRKLILAELKDQLKQPASKELVETELAFPRSVYSFKNAPDSLIILEAVPDQDLGSIIE